MEIDIPEFDKVAWDGVPDEVKERANKGEATKADARIIAITMGKNMNAALSAYLAGLEEAIKIAESEEEEDSD